VLGDWVLSRPLCHLKLWLANLGRVRPELLSLKLLARRHRPEASSRQHPMPRARKRSAPAMATIAPAPSGYSGAPMAQELSLLLLARLA
jgi:hypothetical protein